MSEVIKISWKLNDRAASGVSYFINSKKIGENDEGFEKILGMIRNKKMAVVIIKINPMYGLGGGTTEDQLPFKEKFGEFKKALGARKLVYDFLS